MYCVYDYILKHDEYILYNKPLFQTFLFSAPQTNATPKLFSLVNWRQLKPGDMLVVHGTKGSKDGKELLEAKRENGRCQGKIWVFPKNRGKHPKMDGENNGENPIKMG